MHIMGFWNRKLCPYCQLEVEDTNHIIQCKLPAMIDSFTEATSTLVEHIETVDMDPGILRYIKIYIPYKVKISSTIAQKNRLNKNLTDQDDIVWIHFLEGIIKVLDQTQKIVPSEHGKETMSI